MGGTALKKAREGETSFKLTQRGTFWGIFLGTPKEVKIVTVAPFRPHYTSLVFVKGKGIVFAHELEQDTAAEEEDDSAIIGVFEVVRDLTADYQPPGPHFREGSSRSSRRLRRLHRPRRRVAVR